MQNGLSASRVHEAHLECAKCIPSFAKRIKEITRAAKEICKKVLKNEIHIDQIDENEIKNNLYTKDLPDPDLIIRTGGDSRLSNFLLWQGAYTELVFFKKTWPDFTKEDFLKAISEFKSRERRFGGY